jgi:hypothetical protein
VRARRRGRAALAHAHTQGAHARLRSLASGFHLAHLLQLLAADHAGGAAHAAHVAANVSSTPLGRALIAAAGEGRAALLVRVLCAEPGGGGAAAVARRGAACALRNCALDAAVHGALLSGGGAEGDALVRALLAPLSPRVRAAEDEGVREACADAIAALAGSDAGRAALWAAGAVEALRVAYEDEEVPGVCAALEHAVRDRPLAAACVPGAWSALLF